MIPDDVKFNWKEEKIQLCKMCEGTGKKEKRLNMDEVEMIDCPSCKGSGRVIKTVTVLYTPYKVSE